MEEKEKMEEKEIHDWLAWFEGKYAELVQRGEEIEVGETIAILMITLEPI